MTVYVVAYDLNKEESSADYKPLLDELPAARLPSVSGLGMAREPEQHREGSSRPLQGADRRQRQPVGQPTDGGPSLQRREVRHERLAQEESPELIVAACLGLYYDSIIQPHR